MCGRYQFVEKEDRDIQDILNEIDHKYGEGAMKTGEIFPTNLVPVLVPRNAAIIPELLIWGFPNFHNKGVVINARAETAQERPMFKKSLLTKRCVIPTTGFYEWDAEKKKYLFTMPDAGLLYMAGLFNMFDGEERFTILTTEANTSMTDIHNRMPVVLKKDDLNGWIFDTEEAMQLLHRAPPLLEKIVVV